VCPLAPALPALFVPWPWQAPLNWLGLGVALAFIVVTGVWSHHRAWGSASGIAGRLRPSPLLWWSKTGLALASLAILLLVTFPSMTRNEAWYDSQWARYAGASQPCSLSNLFTIAAANFRAVSGTYWVAMGLLFLSFLVPAMPGALIFLRRRVISCLSH